MKTESGRERIDGKKKNKKKIEMSLEKPILGGDLNCLILEMQKTDGNYKSRI